MQPLFFRSRQPRLKRVACAMILLAAVPIGAIRFVKDSPRLMARESRSDGTHVLTILSTTYDLDRIYKSMEGPRGNHAAIMLAEKTAKDTIWLTGIETQVVDAESLSPLPDEFFCHANLTFHPGARSPEDHNASFSPQAHLDWRILTLIPGRMSIRFPSGFGIPLKADTPVDYFTMALNQNPGPDRKVRMKSTLTYTEQQNMRPLFLQSLYVYQQHRQPEDSAGVAIMDGEGSHQGEHCGEICRTLQIGQSPSWHRLARLPGIHPGETCCVASASPEGVVPQFGDSNTMHWMVPPGKHTYRTEVTQQLELPFDTTVHYVTAHLHPYGKRIWLRDMESGQNVFEVTAHDYPDRLGVASMTEISSQEGIPIRRGHRYELLCEYDNTTESDTDAMAILYLYVLDQVQ